jgi:acyl dehydratase
MRHNKILVRAMAPNDVIAHNQNPPQQGRCSGAHSMTTSAFSTPIDDRYFEDYVEGAVFEFGPIAVEEDEIIAVAKRFDPQSFHIDPEKAVRGPFKGLIASGWHTVGLMTRLFMQNYLSAVASLGSPGLDEIRWQAPVRPGDRLRVRITVLETKPSRSKTDRGLVVSQIEAINQDGVTVCSFKAMNLLAKRVA